MNIRNKNNATLIGLAAVVLWASNVGLIRNVSESFGPTGGAALIYTVASVILCFTLGFPRLREFPRRYLVWGSLLFVSYELCFALSIGYANNGQQAIEVGIVNYLWPTFTIVAAILFNNQKASLLIFPGLIVSLMGICWVLGGEQGLDFLAMAHNIQANPLSYSLAFLGSLIWAIYSIATAKFADGKNGITLFFVLTAIALWCKYISMGGGSLAFSSRSSLMLGLAAAAMGFGYGAWNIGILHGNVTVLAGASYFTPVLSAALAALMLRTPLSFSFWQGAAMVCAGSVICWLATRERRA